MKRSTFLKTVLAIVAAPFALKAKENPCIEMQANKIWVTRRSFGSPKPVTKKISIPLLVGPLYLGAPSYECMPNGRWCKVQSVTSEDMQAFNSM